MSAAPSANTLYRAAQEFIREGQPVFPCRAAYEDPKRKAKAPLTKNGLKDATLDRATVKNWWSRFGSSAAIGIPTGIVYDVLDVDMKGENDGRVHLPYLHRLGLLNGCQRIARTPSGGWHLYFPAAQGITNTARAKLGLDVRGKGGYVLASPSYIDTTLDPDGGYAGSYETLDDPTGNTVEPLLWDLIVATLEPVHETTKKPIELLGYERRASLASLRGWLSERVSGERNNALHWAVCRCIDNGLDPHELLEPALLIGLNEEEVLLTIESALRRAGVVVDDLLTEGESLFPEVD